MEPIAIAAAIIIYHPGEDLISNMESFYPYVQRIYVFDNTENPALLFDPARYPKVSYHHDGENKGIAKRLNEAAAKALAEGYSWLLTMDQDSFFSKEAIENYLQCFQKFEHKQGTALIGPVFQQPVTSLGCQWQETDHLITSGALTNLRALEKIGSFDEMLFIDSVDCDYCIRAQLCGFKLIQFAAVFMNHEMGTTVRRASIKTLYLFKKKKALHSPVRCYYMLRNYLYIRDKFKGLPVKRIPVMRQVVKDKLTNYLLYGRDSKKLLQHLILAYRHYKAKKMGRLSNT